MPDEERVCGGDEALQSHKASVVCGEDACQTKIPAVAHIIETSFVCSVVTEGNIHTLVRIHVGNDIETPTSCQDGKQRVAPVMTLLLGEFDGRLHSRLEEQSSLDDNKLDWIKTTSGLTRYIHRPRAKCNGICKIRDARLTLPPIINA